MQAPEDIPRCEVTHNPCGTDTWTSGNPCQCKTCQQYLSAIAIQPAAATARIKELEAENARLQELAEAQRGVGLALAACREELAAMRQQEPVAWTEEQIEAAFNAWSEEYEGDWHGPDFWIAWKAASKHFHPALIPQEWFASDELRTLCYQLMNAPQKDVFTFERDTLFTLLGGFEAVMAINAGPLKAVSPIPEGWQAERSHDGNADGSVSVR